MSENLTSQVKESTSAEDIRGETLDAIKVSEHILNSLRKKHGENSKEYKEAYKEYLDIKKEIENSISSENQITREELLRISLEFSHLTSLGEQLIDGEKRRGFLDDTLDKFSWIAKSIGLTTDTLKSFGYDTEALNTSQDELIEKIIGNKDGFGNGYIIGYNNKIGNYLIKLGDFKIELKNKDIKEVNALALANYFKYLHSQNSLNRENLIDIFGTTSLSQLGELWKNNEKKRIAKDILTKFGLGDIIEEITKFQALLASPTNFLNNYKNLSEVDQAIAKEYLKKDFYGLRSKLKKSIIEQLRNNPDKEAIATKAIEIILSGNPSKILELNYKFQNEYNTQINVKEAINLAENSSKIQIIQAIDNKNPRENVLKILSQYKEIQKLSTISNTLSQNEILSIGERINNGESYEKIIQELRDNNEELNKKLTAVEKINLEKEEVKKEKVEKTENDKSIIESEGSIFLSTPKLENKIEINENEKKLIDNNPKALENLVNFYNIFKELNLLSVWEYREELVIGMGNINIDLRDDSLSVSELVSFGNKLIILINTLNGENKEKIHENHKSISSMKASLRSFSEADSSINEGKTFNNLGEDRFKALLRQLGIIGGAYFHTFQLRKAIKK